jgi:general secretion pathway protein K
MRRLRRSQRGVALITAMLVVALAATAAVAMVSRQQYDIRRTGNLLQAEQAYLYMQGIEDWAGQILLRDLMSNNVDHTGEEWATILPPIPIDGGQLAGSIEELQGRFNLNDLVNNNVQDGEAVARFRRLLAALGLNAELAMVVVDWLDPDIDPTFPDGAEDDSYLQGERPYRTANAPLVSISEVRLLKGMNEVLDPEKNETVYDRLAGHVCVLPTRVPINVNTATVPVLMSLAEGLTETDAEALLAGRGDEGYADVNAFLQADALAGRVVPSGSIGVASNYFMVTSQVMFGRIVVSYQSMIQRSATGEARILMRAQGTI